MLGTLARKQGHGPAAMGRHGRHRRKGRWDRHRHGPGGRHGRRDGLGQGCRLEPDRQRSHHHMAVVAADAVDVGSQVQGPVPGQGLGLGSGPQHRTPLPDQRRLGLKTAVGQQRSTAGHQYEFGQHHRRVGRLEIAEFRLDVAKGQRPAETGFHGLFFHSIEEGVAAGKHIKVSHLASGNGGPAVTGIHGFAVNPVRRGKEVVRHARSDGRRTYFAQNRHARAFGVGIGGQHLHRSPFAHDIAAAVFIENSRLAIGQKPQPFESQHHRRIQVGVRPAGDHAIVLPALKPPHSQINGLGGRGARGIHHEIRSVAPEYIGDAAGEDIGKQPGNGVLVVFQVPVPKPCGQVAGHPAAEVGVHPGGTMDQLLDPTDPGAHDIFHLSLAGNGAENHGGTVSRPQFRQKPGLVQGLGRGIQAEALGPVHLLGGARGKPVFAIVKGVIRHQAGLDPGDMKSGRLGFLGVGLVVKPMVRERQLGRGPVFQPGPEFINIFGPGQDHAEAGHHNPVSVRIPGRVLENTAGQGPVAIGHRLQDAMVIDTAKPIGTHRRPPRPAGGRLPFHRIFDDIQFTAGQFPMMGQGLEPAVGGQGLMPEGQQRLDHPGHAGPAEQMADLGFDRTDAHRAAIAVDRPQGFHFRPVPHDGRGAVGFHIIDVRRRDPTVQGRKTTLQGQGLAFGVGGGNGFAPSVAAAAHGIDHAEDGIVVAKGIPHPFQDHHPGPFTQNKPVGPRVKGKRAGGRQGTHLAKPHECLGGQVGVEPAHDGRVVIAGQQFPDAAIQGCQGRGAGRIHRVVGPGDPQVVGDAGRLHVQHHAVDRLVGDIAAKTCF